MFRYILTSNVLTNRKNNRKMSVSSQEDCHYYYYTIEGCKRTNCDYRHEPASKGVELRCPQYLHNRRCTTASCPLRHRLFDVSRDTESCLLERTGTCTKPDCSHAHSKKEVNDSSEASENKKPEKSIITCTICKVNMTSETAHSNHLKGRKHLKKLKNQSAMPQIKIAPTKIPPLFANPPNTHSVQATKLKCSPCNVKAMTQAQNEDHLKSLIHKEKASTPILRNPPFHCRACNQTLGNKSAFQAHNTSQEHLAKVKRSRQRPRSVAASNSSSSLFNFDHLDLNQPPPFQDLKVGVFWDLENCPLSSKIDIPGVVQKLKHGHGHKGVFDQFVGACNMDNHKRIALTMQELGMDILPVLNNKKNAADDLLKNKMMTFAENPHCRIILISGDVDFSQHLLHCREKKGHEVVLFHNHVAKESLKSVVTKAFSYHGFVKPFLKDLPDRTRSKSVARGAPPRPKKTSKAVLFFWDMMSLPAPADVKVGAVVSKLRNTFLCATETAEAGFAACRSISQMAAVNHVAQMSVDLSLDSALDMLKEQVETKKDIDILILLTNDIGLSETIRKLKTERKIQIHLIRDEKCQEPLAYSLDEQSQESFQEFIKPLVPAV
ncbi:hypothetical protein TCAL_08811 [Tigriopus californicus]|uniref:C2H2-type domain-containing protein n=1 Tax=Tigriopus californicus TaxID=6832 RepID=A0A553PTB6_TIGCA|nr:uncharacterized protein LOC131891896 [Tigriopus californicus]TRY80931.1 hypothetical protein TCAL_08811 [Tigriopus californicus]|eukprot:TCALIF_08811-PA protein Name:"Similar to KIAA0430 Meiosis arrest female protein 1 (Homo sapiens)" AED:0.00 eAED:0.00 QI:78/1/1/1/0.66/0.75/4/171/606